MNTDHRKSLLQSQLLRKFIYGLIPSIPIWILFVVIEITLGNSLGMIVFPICALGITICFVIDKHERYYC